MNEFWRPSGRKHTWLFTTKVKDPPPPEIKFFIFCWSGKGAYAMRRPEKMSGAMALGVPVKSIRRIFFPREPLFRQCQVNNNFFSEF